MILSHQYSLTFKIGAQSVGAAGIATGTAATAGAATGAVCTGVGCGMVASGASTVATFPMLGFAIVIASVYLILNS